MITNQMIVIQSSCHRARRFRALSGTDRCPTTCPRLTQDMGDKIMPKATHTPTTPTRRAVFRGLGLTSIAVGLVVPVLARTKPHGADAQLIRKDSSREIPQQTGLVVPARIGNWDPCFKPGPCPCSNPCAWVVGL